MSALGTDVSKYQASTPAIPGHSFLFARASIGLTTDASYVKHIANARKSGKIVGAYHFGYDFISPSAQAKLFAAAAGDVDFYFLDVEGKHAMNRAQRQAFYAAFRAYAPGKKIGIYHSLSGFPQGEGQDYNWVAFWSGTPPHIPWTFWQYRGSPLDLDRFIGSEAQLRALAHPSKPSKPPRYRIRFLRAFWAYTVTGTGKNARITGRVARRFTKPGHTAPCGPPRKDPYPWPAIKSSRRLVPITGGALKGKYVCTTQTTIRLEVVR